MFLPTLLALFACGPEGSPRADRDGDGWSVVDDCDDSDPSTHPGADEICDGADNDCDGAADDEDPQGPADPIDGFVDRDGDGWGGEASVACSAIAAGGDCDDLDRQTHPAADERCGGGDEDCDGLTDEAGAVDGTRVWFDGDGDGWGDGERDRISCTAPNGYTEQSGDCDDDDPATWPGADEICDGKDSDCDGALPDEERDADGDGDMACEGDCDDGDAARHLDARELCDGLDQDCDSLIDEAPVDGVVWYQDVDGDGHGGSETSPALCVAPSGFVSDGDDCDDADPGLNPSASEICSPAGAPAIDEDCDGLVDEADGDLDPATRSTWYRDRDRDAYGDASSSVDACEPPPGFVASPGDCDDGAASIHPSAQEECDAAGTDEDCDGAVDDADPSVRGQRFYYYDADADGYGGAAVGGLACDTPAGYGEDDSDCDDMDASVNPAAADTPADGLDTDCDGYDALTSLGEIGARISGEYEGDYAGVSLSGVGDVDGDGYGDLLIGAMRSDVSGSQAGAAYLVLGPVSSELDLANAEARFSGENDYDYVGQTVAGAGDVDGDGYDDLLIGASGHDQLGDGAGAAYLVLGPAEGSWDLGDADARLFGAASGDGAGYGLGGGVDLDDDGCADLLVGAYAEDAGGADAGAAYVVMGPVSGDLDLSDADAKIVGEASGDGAGALVVAAGDTDGDGSGDLFVGAPYAERDAGAAYLALGPISGELDLEDADARLTGEDPGDYAGVGLARAGDVDGDGDDDLLVGASGHDQAAGAAYLVLGPVSGEIDLAAADAELTGESRSGYAAAPLVGAGDVDADGFDDLLISAAHDDAGAAYLFLGPVSGEHSLDASALKLVGEVRGDSAGQAMDSAGDVDGDGLPDLLIGAYQNGYGGHATGAAYVVPAADLGL